MCLDGRHCKVQIWDTAGQERFRTITNNYYKYCSTHPRGSNGVVVVFDLSFKKSLQSVQEYWLEEIDKLSIVYAGGQSTDLLS